MLAKELGLCPVRHREILTTDKSLPAVDNSGEVAISEAAAVMKWRKGSRSPHWALSPSVPDLFLT